MLEVLAGGVSGYNSGWVFEWGWGGGSGCCDFVGEWGYYLMWVWCLFW